MVFHTAIAIERIPIIILFPMPLYYMLQFGVLCRWIQGPKYNPRIPVKCEPAPVQIVDSEKAKIKYQLMSGV